MTEIQRVKKVINWLIFMEFAENEREMADKFGYTKSSFSQIINGKVPLSEKFIKKLCSANENINEVWILSGEGEMLKTSQSETGVISVPINVWEVIKSQADSLKSKDRQIDELMSMLKEQIAENKKTVARQGGNAISADVG